MRLVIAIAQLIVAAIAVIFLSSCSDEGSTSRPMPPQVFDFTLADANPDSPTHGQPVAISEFLGRPVVLYVGAAGCEFCILQLVALADLEAAWLDAGEDAVAISMNLIGQEAGVEEMGAGRSIPVLQDTREADVMRTYGINKDDLIVLDREGRLFRQILTSQVGLNLVRTSGQDSVRAWIDELD